MRPASRQTADATRSHLGRGVRTKASAMCGDERQMMVGVGGSPHTQGRGPGGRPCLDGGRTKKAVPEHARAWGISNRSKWQKTVSSLGQ